MSKIAHCDSRGSLNSLNDVLSGEDGDFWLAALKRFLRKENPWTPIGKLIATVTLGKYPTSTKLREVLEAKGHKVSDWAGDILAKTPINQKKADLDLYEVTGTELGFEDGATRTDIYRRAIELGFVTVPAEAGPLLRLELGNQANGEWLLICMEPLTGRNDDPRVFDVERDDDGSWLRTHYDLADDVWGPGYRWVFGRVK